MNERRGPGLRVLVFAYFFPPMGGAGVQRTLKFVRYLPDSGIVPTVICADSAYYAQDESLLGEIPAGTEVIRIPHTPLPARLLALQRRWSRPSAGAGLRKQPIVGTTNRSILSPVWRDRLLRSWAAMQLPDDAARWSRQAQRAAMNALSERPADIVVSSSPPVSAHLAAMGVSRQAGVPWVADFRDLWTGNPAYAAPSWRRGIDQRMERRMLKAASGLMTVSAPLERELAEIAGSRTPTITIPNGYDDDDFTAVEPLPPERATYRIVYAGTFYGHRSPEPFLRGVARWLDENPGARGRLRVRFIGRIGTRFDRAVTTFAARYPGVLERLGYVHHADAVAEMISADALLLVVGGGDAARGTVTGKIFEYLRAGRPILLIGPAGSEAARLIREGQAGEVVDEESEEAIGGVLDRWVLRGAAPEPDIAQAARYERKLLTRQFAEFLYAVHEQFQPRR